MAVGYDYFWTAQVLVACGADPGFANGDGHAASTGIDGDKTLASPLAAFTDAQSRRQLEAAVGMVRAHTRELDKAEYAMAFMQKRRQEDVAHLFDAEMMAACRQVMMDWWA